MADNTEQETTTEAKAPPESYILIRFAAPGAVLMVVENHNVFPGQLIVAGDHLLQQGRKYTEQQERQREETSALVKPKAQILVPK